MKENIVQKLTSKDDKYACAFTDRIVAESHDTDEWYESLRMLLRCSTIQSHW